MRNRKIFTAFVLILVLTLAGCSGGAQDRVTPGGGPENRTPIGAGENPASPPQINQAVVDQEKSQRATALDGAPASATRSNLADAGSAVEPGNSPINPDAAQLTALQQKLASVSADGDGSVTITISDDELTQAVALAQAALVQQGHTAVFQDATFAFSTGQILFSGTVNSDRFSGDATVVFAPFLTNNVLQLDLVSATVNGRTVPPVSLQSVEATVNAALAEAFSQLPPNISLDAVVVQEGILLITGSVTP